MPGGGKKAAFPTLHLHEHDTRAEQDRQKKFLQNRGKSFELKDSPDKEKHGSCSKTDRSKDAKAEQQKTPTKSDPKLLQKLEQEHVKSEQKAHQKWEKEQQKIEKEQKLKLEKEQHKLEKEQQKLEKEQQKLEKEKQKLEKDQSQKLEKEHHKIEKEQHKLEKEQQKLEEAQRNLEKEQQKLARSVEKVKIEGLKGCSSKEGTPTPILKSQKSIDISCLKQKESPKPSPRKSVDLQILQFTRSPLHEHSLHEETKPSTSPLVKN